jgi:protein gp37
MNMGKKSKIEWTDATFNPWIGCTAVSEGCAHCYAEREDLLRHWTEMGWGKGKPRKKTSAAYWQQPLKWAKEAAEAGRVMRVFCGSLCDVFDEELEWNPRAQDPTYIGPPCGSPMDGWREELWALIRETEAVARLFSTKEKPGGLVWLLLTKRIENAEFMLPMDWGEGWPNVWLGVTAENQLTAGQRLPLLGKIPAAGRFVSIEPMLGRLDLLAAAGQPEDEDWELVNEIQDANDDQEPEELIEECDEECDWINYGNRLVESSEHREWVAWRMERARMAKLQRTVDWIICGGESGPRARAMQADWVRDLQRQAAYCEIPFYFKQWGEWAPRIVYDDAAHSNAVGEVMMHVGRAYAGCELDGKEYKEVPEKLRVIS